ncbi:MAG: hypothetical protein RMJ43_13320 [Chloroherpetonaceae bacterium]|nr:hypothetical protein [Chloroherpetonaceae bacterium]
MPFIEGTGLGTPLIHSGTPSAGTNEVQTGTIGGTPTGGTFRLGLNGIFTGPITWVNNNTNLITNIQNALNSTFGSNQIVAAVGTMTGGVGTFTLTFSGTEYQRLDVPAMEVINNLTGTSPTLSIAITTPGVTATHRGCAKGALLIDVQNAVLYINTGTPTAPTWTVVGTQS